MNQLLPAVGAASDSHTSPAFESSMEARVFQAARESCFQAIFHAAALGIGICAPDGQILLCNPALHRMLGYAENELRGRHFLDFTHPDDVKLNQSLFEELRSGKRTTYEMEKRYITKGGAVLWARLVVSKVSDAAGKPLFTIGLVDDITEHKAARHELLDAQKLEAIGHLASGVAHDFNNLLTGILLYCDLLMSSMSEGDRLRRPAEEIRLAAEQGAALVQQLLTVSRKHVVEPRPLSLNETVKSMSCLLSRLIGEQIQLKQELDPDLLPVRMDPVHAQQIILNLVINARDAMPKGGDVVITTGNAPRAAYGPADSRTVTLAVTDNGCGMDPETQSHLFEPFFTTKAPGRGNGLGLATVYRIVHDGRGTILVESQMGKGTRLEIALPAIVEDEGTKQMTDAGQIAEPLTPWKEITNGADLLPRSSQNRALARSLRRKQVCHVDH